MEPVARVYRGEAIEAVHCASVAVVNGRGELTHYLGEPEAVFMTRSSIKPFQLMALVASGGADRFGFTTEQLAIMCGSHGGTDRHREVVLSNLGLAGNSPEHLQCGSHRPIWMEVENVFPKDGEEKDPVRHNCSGKHSGFLALARHLGESPKEYLNPQGKTQKLVKQYLASYCEYEPESMPCGIDGCSAPNFPLPLKNLALGFMKLANGQGDSPEVRAAAERIAGAIRAYPFMVSGENRFDYDISRTFPSNAVSKIGAEAIQGIGFSEPSIGIAVKVSDGAFRALEPIVVEVLRQLGIIKHIDDYPALRRYERPVVRNNRNLVTGNVAVEFKLKKR